MIRLSPEWWRHLEPRTTEIMLALNKNIDLRQSYLHLPGTVTCHPFTIDTDQTFCFLVKSTRSEIDAPSEQRVPKKLVNTFEGVMEVKDHRLFCRVVRNS